MGDYNFLNLADVAQSAERVKGSRQAREMNALNMAQQREMNPLRIREAKGRLAQQEEMNPLRVQEAQGRIDAQGRAKESSSRETIKRGFDHFLNRSKMISDQSTYERWVSEGIASKVITEGELPEKYDKKFMRKLRGETEKALKKISLNLGGGQAQDTVYQGSEVVQKGPKYDVGRRADQRYSKETSPGERNYRELREWKKARQSFYKQAADGDFGPVSDKDLETAMTRWEDNNPKPGAKQSRAQGRGAGGRPAGLPENARKSKYGWVVKEKGGWRVVAPLLGIRAAERPFPPPPAPAPAPAPAVQPGAPGAAPPGPVGPPGGPGAVRSPPPAAVSNPRVGDLLAEIEAQVQGPGLFNLGFQRAQQLILQVEAISGTGIDQAQMERAREIIRVLSSIPADSNPAGFSAPNALRSEIGLRR